MNEKRILIVDDEPDILDAMKEMFSLQGYAVVTAGSAEEALEILARESVMVMFLDLKLPGMSGLDLCKQIRKENRIAVIFAFTGYANFFGLLECRTAGFDDFFTKPVDMQTLIQAAQEAFAKIDRWKVTEYGLA